MDRADDLNSLARKCRELAARITDERTRESLELLARDYEARAAAEEGGAPEPDMPIPE